MSYPVEQAPWPHLREKRVAEILGVAPELLQGLAGHAKLRAVEVVGKSGVPIRLYCREDVENLAARVRP